MANTQFQVEGNAAQLFERDAVPIFGKPLAELTFEHVSLYDGERILDVACGTGIVIRVAVERFENLASAVGVDLNPTMLAVAHENTPTTNVPVEWRQGDMCDLPFPDASFEVALCQNGLQFVSDKLAALREMRRVLAPGGRLIFTVGSKVPPYFAVLADALTRHVSEQAAASSIASYSWSDAEKKRELLNEAGFQAIEITDLDVSFRMPSTADAILEAIGRTPYARDVAALSETSRRTLGQEVSTALEAYRDGDVAIIPGQLHLVQARTP